MSCFSEILKDCTEYSAVLGAIEIKRLPMGVLGLSHIHKAHIVSSLCEQAGKKALLIAPDEATASRLAKDMSAMGCAALFYPARFFSFRSSEGQSREFEHMRLGVLGKMLAGDFDVVVCSAEAALQKTLPPSEMSRRSFGFSVGDEISVESAVSSFIGAGYTRGSQVDGPGQFALRGGILDFFPTGAALPLRAEFWGDTVDSLAFFEPETQRRTDSVASVNVCPAVELLYDDAAQLASAISEHAAGLRGKGVAKARESLVADTEKLLGGVRVSSLDRYLPLLYRTPGTIFDYAPGATLFVSESFAVKERVSACEELMNEEIKGLFEEGVLSKGLDSFTLSWQELCGFYEKLGAVYLDNLPRGSFDTPIRELITVTARQLSAWNGSVSVLLDDISPVLREDRINVVMAGTEKAAKALSFDLEDEGVKCTFFPQLPSRFPRGVLSIVPGSVSAGFEYPQQKFMLVSIGARRDAPALRQRQKTSAAAKKNAFSNLEELHRGDYIVHSAHGIGIFDGITKLEASGTVKDYIKIKYDRADVLYVPVTQLDQVSKYIGPHSDDKPLKLNKLGGKEWQKSKTKVRTAVKEMAGELIELYSKRMKLKGYAFSPDIDMQNDFERRFEFDETADQLRCIDEIKKDMEKNYPMDRLLCGDVGFGKTEVALRGAFKCVADGKQCALLVPTTILALQHFQTIKRRFEGFPIEARMLSRFCSPKEVTDTVKGLKRGSVDIVVGTHRLISKDIEFRDLGLIIVDEEQRFGVAQKERLKEMFPTVDVLTLTATPIPRTLNMAMTGIRDMSVLEEAPQDRFPVQTYVIEHNLEVLAQAMQNELRRGGQVYYLHNRVETIDRAATKIKEFMPDARIAVAHGQMGEDQLSDIWRALLEGEIDILVCTTIIETGIDVPNVNTLIIEDAERMGLSQLHQIRGRVGRSSRRASAYLTFTRGKQLSEIATRRLNAIREFTEFGSGFKIAMRDLELRGAGNILGAQQHGHMEAVGYDMYLKLLAQAIGEEKGETPDEPERECLIDLPIDAHIPAEYIESVPQKLGMYRRIADIRSAEDAEDVLDELLDRFGEPPESVRGLITVSLLRSSALRHGVYEIGHESGKLLLYIEELDMEKITTLARKMRGRISVSSKPKPHISVKLAHGDDRLTLLTRVFDIFDNKEKI